MIRALIVTFALAVTACGTEAPPPEAADEGADSTSAAVADDADEGGLPPLIDREIFFGNPEIAFAALAPAGDRFAFAKELDGVLNIWVAALGESLETARPVTDATDRPVTNYFWSADSRYILYVQDQDGNENFRVYAVDPSAEPADGSRVPAARDLTPFEDVRAQIVSVPQATPERILVGLNDRDARLHDIYWIDLETGSRELVRRNDDGMAGWLADLDGNLRLAAKVTPDGGTEIYTLDGDEPRSVYRCSTDETCAPLQFHADNQRVYMTTNRGEERDLAELVLFDPATGEETLVESDPEKQVDFGSAIFSEVDHRLLATQYVGDRVRTYPQDDAFAQVLDGVRERLDEGDLTFRTQSADDGVWIVKQVLDNDSGPNYVYRSESGELELLYRPNPDIPVEHMARTRAVRYAARDGLEIPAYLTLPQGIEPKNLPTVLLPHGGPWSRDTWGYDSLAQFLANRGYAVLQPNFRGSTGYGKRFLALGNKQWGTGTMQHDLTDAVAWLKKEGYADPDRIAIMGGSYGGYATLAGVAFTPDLYAAGVSIVGPSSILTLLEAIPPYWEPIRAMFLARVGDPDDPDERAMLEAQSPLNSAKQIKAPLLVIQGANDPRVKQAESDQIVTALRDLGRDVRYLVAKDEGHGFANELNNLASFAVIEQFLAKHLGGRFQESMNSEVRERVADLDVDLEFLNRPGPEA